MSVGLAGEPTVRYDGRPSTSPGRRRMRRPRSVRLGQLLVGEFALLGIAAAYTGPRWAFAGVSAAAGAVLVATFGRTGGRWWYQAVAYRRRYAQRRKRAAASLVATAVSQEGAVALPWLRALAPGLQLQSVTVRETQVGIACDDEGWFGAVAIDAPEGLAGAPLTELPIDALGALVLPGLGGRAPSASSVQLVLHNVANPDAGLGDAPAAQSYVELLGSDQLTGRRGTWLAVRLSPLDALPIEARGGVAGVEASIGGAVLRAAKILRDHGHRARVLDPAGLAAATIEGGGLDGPPQEHWSHWRSGSLAHVCYTVTRWPANLPVGRVTAALPGVSSVAIAFTAGAEPNRHVLLRVAAEPNAIGRVCRELGRIAGQAGLRLRRIDGEQAPGAYGSVPTGIAPAGLIRRSVPVGVAGTGGGAAGTEGLLLGRDSNQAAVPVRLFRPEPTRLALVGGWWLGRLVAFRALGVGARVIVRTAYPQQWSGLGEAATGGGGRLFVTPAERPMVLTGTPHAPVLLIDDLGPAGEASRPDGLALGPWQTRATLLPQFSSYGFAAATGADAVLLQRLTPEEATTAAAVLRLSDETVRLVQMMHDDMVAILGGGADRYVWTCPTRIEGQILGAPRRA